MACDPLPEVISSRTRLKVADLVSTRLRTLGELAAATGISIQGVLKHLRKLEELGLVEETSVRSPGLAVRKVYAAKGTRLRDFSAGGLTLVKLSGKPSSPPEEPDRPLDLEYLAEEAILQRRRVRDQARRLGRMIDDLVEDESRIKVALESMDLSDIERLILQVLFTEESLEEGERVLLEHFGLQGGKESIEKALSKARHQLKKRTGR
ncbi:MAG: helix-turn-helix domain-containing protein [Nitrososphaerales archaeon]|jgi:DNA-binding transcriptional ArsR family regulator